MNKTELTTYLNNTVEDAFEQYCEKQMGVPYDQKQNGPFFASMSREQQSTWQSAVGALADLFEDAVHNLDWDRDERDI